LACDSSAIPARDASDADPVRGAAGKLPAPPAVATLADDPNAATAASGAPDAAPSAGGVPLDSICVSGSTGSCLCDQSDTRRGRTVAVSACCTYAGPTGTVAGSETSSTGEQTAPTARAGCLPNRTDAHDSVAADAAVVAAGELTSDGNAARAAGSRDARSGRAARK
jgi:hypothetical protein